MGAAAPLASTIFTAVALRGWSLTSWGRMACTHSLLLSVLPMVRRLTWWQSLTTMRGESTAGWSYPRGGQGGEEGRGYGVIVLWVHRPNHELLGGNHELLGGQAFGGDDRRSWYL